MQDQAFTVEVPGVNYWKRQIKCQDGCPVHTDSRGYVRAIAEGDYEKAYLIARGPNPLASICGRICGAPCEAACRRSDIDEAVSIRALKRFVTEKFGAEAGEFQKDFLSKMKSLLGFSQPCESQDSIKNLADYFKNTSLELPEDAPSVGIIGSGPAGLAAAHDLCLMGIKPVIYEMEPVPAGMLYLGVPEYRLPRDLIEAEVDVIKALGTEIHCNVQVGKDIAFSELREKHDAVLIAVGAKKSRTIPIPNVDAPGVVGGIDFLRDVALKEDVKLGEKVVVIGGGNVAYDVARTLIRQTEYDVSRTAIRQKGVKEVHLVCLESFDEMPADTVEIDEGEEEGVSRHNSWGPKEILTDEQGKVKGVRFIRCNSVFDENKQFAPKFDEEVKMELEADNVFLSIGQALDLSFIDSDEVTLTERGLLKLDMTKTCTDAPGVFAAGDVSLGPGLMIDAIANGKEAARKMYAYITKKQAPRAIDVVSHEEILRYRRELGYESLPREGVPATPPELRKKAMDVVVEKGFSEDQGIRQGDRCLDCSINTIFDGEKCILCGGCADVCPEGCLKLVSVDRLKGNEDVDKLLDNYYQGAPPSSGGAIIKDETRCIRCGLCAERCPVGAITMESFFFKEVFK
jgi:NADPH-dependent glutamate synthase beta subunit-like oxidoreductase